MTITIEDEYVCVNVNGNFLNFDCKAGMDINIERMKGHVRLKFYDRYDYQRIMTFILQHRRTLSMKGGM